jgi:hypothetical protein
MPITINGNGTITGASTLATPIASPTFTTPNIDSAQFATVSGTAPIYPCRAWVNFNGTGTVAIRASGNVTSITDNGTGDYTVNFTTAMPDANYTMAGSLEGTSDPGSVFPYTAGGTGTAPTLVTTTQYRMRTTLSTDANFISVAFHR